MMPMLMLFVLLVSCCIILCSRNNNNNNNNNGFVVVVDAWMPASSSSSIPSPVVTVHRRYSYLSSPRLKLTAVDDAKNNKNKNDDDAKRQLPDFGKTTIQVDTIKLEKKTRRRKTTKTEEEEEDVSSKWIRKDLFGSSLVDQTMEELKQDTVFLDTQKRIERVGLDGITKEERTQRRRALTNLNVEPFGKFLAIEMNKQQQQQNTNENEHENEHENKRENDDQLVKMNMNKLKPFRLQRKEPKILQINIGLYCNQACSHCHVESSPMRTSEMMTTATVVQCLELLKTTPSITTLDITGGAPELNTNFRYLVSTARALRGPSEKDLIIIDRCNLTVLQEPGQDDLVDFLKHNNVHIIASLPCYSADNVDTQRGNGVFERSIAGLLALNRAGYGHPPAKKTNTNNDDVEDGTPLHLDLVYNPLGGFLPPPQEQLEVQYKTQLEENFGILFNSLYTITNMPIKRFADFLHRRNELEDYMDLLVRNFNPDTVSQLMCLDTINIGWDGQIYDCDFNQQLSLPISSTTTHDRRELPGSDDNKKSITTVFDIESLYDLQKTKIRTDNHCFGCTAGMGSS